MSISSHNEMQEAGKWWKDFDKKDVKIVPNGVAGLALYQNVSRVSKAREPCIVDTANAAVATLLNVG